MDWDDNLCCYSVLFAEKNILFLLCKNSRFFKFLFIIFDSDSCNTVSLEKHPHKDSSTGISSALQGFATFS